MLRFYLDWTEFKSVSGFIKYRDLGGKYFIYKVDDDVIWYTKIRKDSSADQTDFEDNYKSTADTGNKFRISHTPEGMPLVAVTKSYNVATATRISVVYSDKTTWWCNATQVVDEIATSTDDTSYDLVNTNMINLDKITERDLSALDGYDITVKVNDVVVTSGFTINHSNTTGQVVFDTANSPGDVVKVSYYYSGDSCFVLTPPTGKAWRLDYTELQFSVGAVLNDNMVFKVIVNHAGTSNNDVTAGQVSYNNAKDILSRGNIGNIVEPFGEFTKNIIQVPFNYISGYVLFPVGVAADPVKKEFNKIIVELENDQAITSSEIATATFYSTEWDI